MSAPPLCRLEVAADPVGTSTAAVTIEHVARGLGFDPSRATKVRCLAQALAEEAALRLGDPDARLEVEAVLGEGALHVAVRDQGLPVTSATGGLPQDLVGLGFADGLHVGTDGARGNVADFHVVLPDADWRSRLAGEVEVLSPSAPEADPQEPLDVRKLGPDDAEELTRCFWRSWGFGYPYPDVYRPELLAARLRSGERRAFGAVRADGEVVGNYQFDLTAPWAKVGHTGGAIVDPRFRSRGLLQQLQDLAAAEIAELGLWATVGEPVLNHPRTQRNTTKAGGVMVGLILAIRPAVAQTGFDGTGEARTSILSSLIPRAAIPPRTLWVPGPHRAIVERCAAELSAPVELPVPEAHRPGDTPSASRVETTLHAEWGLGNIVVHEVGADLVEAIDEQTAALVDSGAVTIQLDLPLGQGATAAIGGGLQELGYVYCSWVPERFEDGDALRLQHLVRPQVDPDAWVLDADHTRWLVDQVMAQLSAVGRHDRQVRRNRARMQGIYSVLDA
jgi:anti-sigma regulatory factor (Ser/Thr protein kinase)